MKLRTIAWALLALALAGCTAAGIGQAEESEPEMPQAEEMETEPVAEALPTAAPQRAALPDLGPAPELHNEIWLNTPAPLRLADLRGKVVLLDMWTFG